MVISAHSHRIREAIALWPDGTASVVQSCDDCTYICERPIRSIDANRLPLVGATVGEPDQAGSSAHANA